MNGGFISKGGEATGTSNYIYPGAACSFPEANVAGGGTVFGTLRALRKKCSSGAEFIMVANLFKTVGSGTFSIGGAAEVISSATEFKALDDANGQYGGDESAPLGYIYAPDPAAGSTGIGTQT